MSGYAFISNSTKPTNEKQCSREPVKLGNVNRPCLKTALDMGYDVYFGINRANPEGLECELPVHLFDSHTYRSVTAFKDNLIAYKNFSRIVEEGGIDVIHCNTPVGGLIGRLVGKRYSVKKIIYTAHGFHFYKGAPLINRTLYKWAEQIMAHWTDVIITMNQEDYEAAQKFKLKKGGKVYKVHGVGINLSDFSYSENREEKRKELGLCDSSIAIISAGDLVARKNYRIAIEAVARTNDKRLHYFICGEGPELENLKRIAKEKNVADQIHFLGYRKDMKDLFYASDIFLFTTRQEGMPRSMMEAMACGLPCVVSKIRGNVDLLEDGKGGFLKEVDDVQGYADSLETIANDQTMRQKMKEYNLKEIRKYDEEVVKKEIDQIYHSVLSGL